MTACRVNEVFPNSQMELQQLFACYTLFVYYETLDKLSGPRQFKPLYLMSVFASCQLPSEIATFYPSIRMKGLVPPSPIRLALIARNIFRHSTKLSTFNTFAALNDPPTRNFSSNTWCLNSSHNFHSRFPLNQAKSPGSKTDEKEEGISFIDENISIEYPESDELPRTPIIQGRGGRHFKRTLAQFSLEESVTVVTGGASGIGLAISQGIVASGSHLAIVDMNREDFTAGVQNGTTSD
ncbi:unnamed protein product [Penicillium pancosmium]